MNIDDFNDFFTERYEKFSKFAAVKLNSFSKIYRKHTDPEVLDFVHSACMSAVKQDTETGLAPCETFVGTSANMESWFKTIVVNKMKDKFKSAPNNNEVLLSDLTYFTTDEIEPVSARNQDVLTMLKAIWPYLYKKQKPVVFLKYIGLEPGERTEVLGLPENTIKSRLNRANRNIKKRLKIDNLKGLFN